MKAAGVGHRYPASSRPSSETRNTFSSAEKQVLYQCHDYQHSDDESDKSAEHREPHHAVVRAHSSCTAIGATAKCTPGELPPDPQPLTPLDWADRRDS
jgi:hypothetical protein